MSIRNAIVAVLCLIIAAACGGGGGDEPTPTPSPAPTETPDFFPTPAATVPTVLRVAYLNLMAPPIGAEEGVTVEHETFDARLEIIIGQFQEFGADLVGVSEAEWVEGLGSSAWTRLAGGLQLEGIFVRANPWCFGQSQDESDGLVDELGFEEGEYLLSRHPIIEARRFELPALSFCESRVVLYAVVSAPEPIGEIDVYVTRFGGDESMLGSQARSLLSTIALTHDPDRAVIIMGDLGAPPDSDALKVLTDAGYLDPLIAQTDALTCCRSSVRFEAGALTPTATATVDPQNSPDPEATPEVTPAPEPGPAGLTMRTDYILVGQWGVETWQLLAELPAEQPGGQALFASDHNGIGIVFDLAPLAATNR